MKKMMVSAFFCTVLASGLAMADPKPDMININTADQVTLSSTPGIGKAKAKTIVQYRKEHGPFKEVHDLTHVKGISEKSLQTILKKNPGKIVAS